MEQHVFEQQELVRPLNSPLLETRLLFPLPGDKGLSRSAERASSQGHPLLLRSPTDTSPFETAQSKMLGLFRLYFLSCSFLGRAPPPPLSLCFSFTLSFGFSNQPQTIQTLFHSEESRVNHEFGSSIFGCYYFIIASTNT